jgi:hypothetical protein
MTDTIPPGPLTLTSRVDQVFPMLSAEQIARVAVHGQVRHVQGRQGGGGMPAWEALTV